MINKSTLKHKLLKHKHKKKKKTLSVKTGICEEIKREN